MRPRQLDHSSPLRTILATSVTLWSKDRPPRRSQPVHYLIPTLIPICFAEELLRFHAIGVIPI